MVTTTSKPANRFANMTETDVANLSPWELNEYTTWLLRSKGNTWSGRNKKDINVSQCRFEQKRVHNTPNPENYRNN